MRTEPASADARPRRLARVATNPRLLAAVLTAGAVAVGFTACGTQGIQLASTNPDYKGAKLFLEHCSGCHSLAVVGAEGSATSIKDRVRTNGPNFNFRKEDVAQVIYAIHNGGFSGAIMPQNILVGQEAREVAAFLAKYSGLQAPKVPVIENTSFGASTTSSTTASTAASATSTAGASAAASTTAAPGASQAARAKTAPQAAVK